MNNSQHYDSIAEAWQYIFGEHFHWGYFDDSTNKIDEASTKLIQLMLNGLIIKKETKIVDIGCGIGNTSQYLNQQFDCFVEGFSNSPKGIEFAKSNNKSPKINFSVRDALNNGFEDEIFDISWLLEMSHLIQDKDQLIKDSSRVLKPGGKIVLCDLMFKKPLTAQFIFENKEDLIKLEKSFGQAKIELMENYTTYLEQNGFADIEFIDISENVIDTTDSWKENITKNYGRLSTCMDKEAIENFIYSCDLLKKYYQDKVWGYGIIKGTKQ